jgi:sec-independent protein translocase protein TatC
VRLLRALAAVAVGMVVTYGLADRLIGAMARASGLELYFFSPTEAFWTTLKVSFFSGLALAFPVVLFELWRFVAPGLYSHERRYALPFIVCGTLFFGAGLVFSHFIVLPFALEFLIGFGAAHGLRPMLSIGLYVDFYLKVMLAFGVVFEMPIAIVLLAKLGLVTPEFLARHRRYAVLANAVLAAVLTPTADVFNMLLMMIPLLVFYELGIIGARLFGRTSPAFTDEAERRA